MTLLEPEQQFSKFWFQTFPLGTKTSQWIIKAHKCFLPKRKYLQSTQTTDFSSASSKCPRAPYSFTNHSRKRLKFFRNLRKQFKIYLLGKTVTGSRVHNTPQSQLFSAGSQIQTARRHPRQTSNLQSHLQRILLHRAQTSAVGRGDRGDQREDPRGHAQKGEHGWSCSSTRFQDRRPGHTLPLGSVPTMVLRGWWEVRQSRQHLNTRPSSRRFPAENEPAAQVSDSWNHEALKPILSLPIYCRLREES